jgi:hypothetical protein
MVGCDTASSIGPPEIWKKERLLEEMEGLLNEDAEDLVLEGVKRVVYVEGLLRAYATR